MAENKMLMQRVWVTSNMFAEFTPVDESTTDYKLVLDHLGPYEIGLVVYHRTINYGLEEAIKYREKTTKLTEFDVNINGFEVSRSDDLDDCLDNWDPRLIEIYMCMRSKDGTEKRYYVCHANDGDCVFFEEECPLGTEYKTNRKKIRFWHDDKGRLVSKDVLIYN